MASPKSEGSKIAIVAVEMGIATDEVADATVSARGTGKTG